MLYDWVYWTCYIKIVRGFQVFFSGNHCEESSKILQTFKYFPRNFKSHHQFVTLVWCKSYQIYYPLKESDQQLNINISVKLYTGVENIICMTDKKFKRLNKKLLFNIKWLDEKISEKKTLFSCRSQRGPVIIYYVRLERVPLKYINSFDIDFRCIAIIISGQCYADRSFKYIK